MWASLSTSVFGSDKLERGASLMTSVLERIGPILMDNAGSAGLEELCMAVLCTIRSDETVAPITLAVLRTINSDETLAPNPLVGFAYATNK